MNIHIKTILKKKLYSNYSKVHFLRNKYFHRRELKSQIQKTKLPIKNLKLSKQKYLKSIEKYYGQYNIKIDPTNHLIYSYLNNSDDVKYIPDELWYGNLSSMMNNNEYSNLVSDKNLNDRFLDLPMPPTLLRKMEGEVYDTEYNFKKGEETFRIINNIFQEHQKIIVKPSVNASRGRGVKICENAQELIKEIKNQDNVIVQPVIKQHPILRNFNESSVNTLRIMTYFNKGKVRLVSSYLRVGNKDSIVDNLDSGGYAVGIDSRGKLKNKGYSKPTAKTVNIDLIYKNEEERMIPNYELIIKLCNEQHMKLPWFQVVSWDVAINEKSEPIFIELNVKSQGIFGHQVANGPLFGDQTKSILNEYFVRTREKNEQ